MLARERIVVAVMRTRNTGGDIVTAPATAVLASARMRGDVQPYLADADCVLYHGDALDVLRELPDESVHCIATSPPFYALRDYGTGRWEGGDEACEHREASGRINSAHAGQRNEKGDAFRNSLSYQQSGGGNFGPACGKCGARRIDQQIGLEETPDAWAAALVAVFREARRVLRKDGTLWVECGDSYVSGQGGRQSAVGELPPTTRFDRKEAGNPREGLPSSFGERDVGPRFYPAATTGLKPKDLLGSPWLLAFALRADGWWLRGCNIWAKPNAMPESAKDRCTTAHSYVFQLSKSARYFFDGDAIREPFSASTQERIASSPGTYAAPNAGPKGRANTDRNDGSGRRMTVENGANPRSVWTIPTQGYPEAHFATWPETLARRIILAGCPTDGTVLDPFVGSGTTCFVARKLGRRSIGIDLNAEYLELAARRLQQQSLFA